MDNQFFTPDNQPPVPSTNEPISPAEVSPPSPEEPKSYTPTAFDRYNTLGSENKYFQPMPPKKSKTPKKPNMTTTVLTSAVVSVIACVLVVLVMIYGMGIGNMLQNTYSEISSDTVSASSGGATTNIVVDTTAQTNAEAVAEKAAPSVVGIVVTTSVNHYFFGASDSESEGSGIIYSADGYIITNYHVVAQAAKNAGTVSVYLAENSNQANAATIVGYDISSDLAVIKIDKKGLTAIELGNSDAIKVGQTAIAIGNPGGMDFMGSVSMGIISGLDRTLQLENSNTEINLIQTDASINPGNSGGALVDSQGKLIGINSAKMASANFEGMGFAIPVNDAVEIVERIIKNIDAPKPYIGVEISTYYSGDTLQMMGYPAGVVVAGVTEGSPADEAGLMRSDIITHFNGNSVTDYTEFNSEKAKYAPGDTIKLTIYRRGKTYTASLTLGTANN